MCLMKRGTFSLRMQLIVLEGIFFGLHSVFAPFCNFTRSYTGFTFVYAGRLLVVDFRSELSPFVTSCVVSFCLTTWQDIFEKLVIEF